ncbi:hypothetical protein NKH77_09995 [Streptomyces sp. M19]
MADERDFAAMRRYASFGFADHTEYLRRMEGLLRTLSSQGVHTTVALFDPVAYERFCAEIGLDPDTADGRARYTAEAATAAGTVTYDGRPLAQVLHHLVGTVERQATWECATVLLARAGERRHGGEDASRAALERADLALRALLDAVGPGSHHLVCSVPVDGTSLVAVCRAETPTDASPSLADVDALLFRTVLACGIVTDGAGASCCAPPGPATATRSAAGRCTTAGRTRSPRRRSSRRTARTRRPANPSLPSTAWSTARDCPCRPGGRLTPGAPHDRTGSVLSYEPYDRTPRRPHARDRPPTRTSWRNRRSPGLTRRTAPPAPRPAPPRPCPRPAPPKRPARTARACA